MHCLLPIVKDIYIYRQPHAEPSYKTPPIARSPSAVTTALDLVEPFPKVQGTNTLLFITYQLSGFYWLFITVEKASANIVAGLTFDRYFVTFGLPFNLIATKVIYQRCGNVLWLGWGSLIKCQQLLILRQMDRERKCTNRTFIV